MILDSDLILFTKSNSKGSQIYVKCIAMKLLEENMGEILETLGMVMVF